MPSNTHDYLTLRLSRLKSGEEFEQKGEGLTFLFSKGGLTAMSMAVLLMIKGKLIPALVLLKRELEAKQQAYQSVVKIGRTHLMDATPLTLGQEFSGYASQLAHGIEALENAVPHLREIALRGDCRRTGLNAPKGFGVKCAAELSELTGETFVPASNKFEALAANDAMVEVSGALKRLACSFIKIANDIRWMDRAPVRALESLSCPPMNRAPRSCREKSTPPNAKP